MWNKGPAYIPISSIREPNEPETPRLRRSRPLEWKNVALAILVVLSTALSLIVIRQQVHTVTARFEYSALDLVSSSRPKKYTWWSNYSDPRELEGIDQKWAAIMPAHGIVAVDSEWAFKKQLPDSLAQPDDPSKKVYIIDAYHQLHCLKIIRKTFYQLSRGEDLTFPLGHSTHCFDSLRQYVQCTAGDTLLYSWGLNTTGDGQQRQCRDWSALSQWAAQHTACYRDSEQPIPLLEHFGHCDDGQDGLAPD